MEGIYKHNRKEVQMTVKTTFGDRIVGVTEWYNAEGYDIAVDEKIISLTDEEFNAVVTCQRLLYTTLTEEEE